MKEEVSQFKRLNETQKDQVVLFCAFCIKMARKRLMTYSGCFIALSGFMFVQVLMPNIDAKSTLEKLLTSPWLAAIPLILAGICEGIFTVLMQLHKRQMADSKIPQVLVQFIATAKPKTIALMLLESGYDISKHKNQ